MAKSEYILNIGDDNVVLTRLVNKKVANAWLGSPDPAMAMEELGEALAADTKAPISILIDTLDQTYKEEEIPKVGVLDRRKVLARHINMAFPGANLRGARLVAQTEKKTLLYQFASVPLDGRVPGWIDFIDSLPNENAGIFTIAAENVDIMQALVPKDLPPIETGTHWRHLIGINVTGGLRQIIEKNGRLCLTRLTQAPPPETPPDEFADMIIRDFKATITYIRRLGYAVGDVLDLVVLTTPGNKEALEGLTWEGARSVSIYTPYEAGATLGLGSIGREDQAYGDVLHAAWFASKGRPVLPLTRSVALGDAKDDFRELAFVAAPYAAGVLMAAVIGWSGFTGYQAYTLSQENQQMDGQLAQARASLSDEQKKVADLPYEAARMRNILEVNAALDSGKIDLTPTLQNIAKALEGDAVVTTFKFKGDNSANGSQARGAAQAKGNYSVIIGLRLADVIIKAEEAVQVSRKLERRLNDSFGTGFKIQMTKEPVAAKGAEVLNGAVFTNTNAADTALSGRPDQFNIEFAITKGGA